MSLLHNDINIILTLRKKMAIRINTSDDTTLGKQGTCNSKRSERQYKLESKAFKMEITRGIQLPISPSPLSHTHTHTQYTHYLNTNR